ncbi:hypothetical protein ARMSODRAFT_964546 [Armillaria solidipes]|uniref:Secreted protein n=1 Tax=Armillaria solidipes TaxID=1076256 RepID=A0A2H3BFY1_9AGAR|nr:hypothetical protein ARMSODRAFT_964546 [Armillaria solidipes]
MSTAPIFLMIYRVSWGMDLTCSSLQDLTRRRTKTMPFLAAQAYVFRCLSCNPKRASFLRRMCGFVEMHHSTCKRPRCFEV